MDCKHPKTITDRGELVCCTCGLVLQARMPHETNRKILSVRLGTLRPLSEEIVIRDRVYKMEKLQPAGRNFVYSGSYSILVFSMSGFYRNFRGGKVKDRVRKLLEFAKQQNSLLSLEDFSRILKASKPVISKALKGISDRLEYRYSGNARARPNGVFFRAGSGKDEYFNLGGGIVGEIKFGLGV